MGEIQVFEHARFGRVHVEAVGEEPWFVAKDVCDALGIDKTAASRLDGDEKGLRLTQTHGGEQQVLFVNEPGFYKLVMRSRKPEAKAFQRWVTHEVLPAIRRTGGYMAASADETPKEEIMARALRIADDTMRRQKSTSQPWPRRTPRCARRRSSPTRLPPHRTARAWWASWPR